MEAVLYFPLKCRHGNRIHDPTTQKTKVYMSRFFQEVLISICIGEWRRQSKRSEQSVSEIDRQSTEFNCASKDCLHYSQK